MSVFIEQLSKMYIALLFLGCSISDVCSQQKAHALTGSIVLFNATLRADNVATAKWAFGDLTIVQVVGGVPYFTAPYLGRANLTTDYTLELQSLSLTDTGMYVSTITYPGSILDTEESSLQVYNISGGELPKPVVKMYKDGQDVSVDPFITKEESYNLSATVPANEPAAISVTFEVQYNDASTETLLGCANCSSECNTSWTPSTTGQATLTTTYSHPATPSMTAVKTIKVQDPPCASNPCQNSGMCTPVDGGYTCICPPNYSSVNCEIDDSPCASNPCQNSGTCTTDGGAFNCDCTDNYDGVICENKSKAGGLEWWAILLIVLAVLAVIGLIIGLLYCYKQCCFAEK